MPQIIRAHFLFYENFRRNADKVFNLFVIRDDDGNYRCITENGRRNTNLVVRTVCEKSSLATAESYFRQKLNEKKEHRETPYSDDSRGHFISQTAKSFDIDRGDSPNYRQSNPESSASRPIVPVVNAQSANEDKNQENVAIKQSTTKEILRPPKKGVFNQDQMNSLEL